MTATLVRESFQSRVPKGNRRARRQQYDYPLAKTLKSLARGRLTENSVAQFQAAHRHKHLSKKYKAWGKFNGPHHQAVSYWIWAWMIAGVVFFAAAFKIPACLIGTIVCFGIAKFVSNQRLSVVESAADDQKIIDKQMLNGYYQWRTIELLVDTDNGIVMSPYGALSVPPIPRPIQERLLTLKRELPSTEFELEYYDSDPFIIAIHRDNDGKPRERYYIEQYDENGYTP